jgi:nucleotide-binding universal stress UspA family protein
MVLYVQPAESTSTHFADRKELSADTTDLGNEATTEARRILDAANLPFACDTEPGDPADVIVRSADAEQVDEIVMGSRGMARWTGLALGSVAYKVIHRARMPVTIVSPSPQEANPPTTTPSNSHRILLAVDGSKHASHATHYVCRLRGARDLLYVELLNVQLTIPPGRIQGSVNPEMIASTRREEGESALRAASEALHAAHIKFNPHIVSGHPAEKIVELAAKHDCTRVVMGTRGLGPISGVVLGSVAYKVLHLSPVPVTLVK